MKKLLALISSLFFATSVYASSQFDMQLITWDNINFDASIYNLANPNTFALNGYDGANDTPTLFLFGSGLVLSTTSPYKTITLDPKLLEYAGVTLGNGTLLERNSMGVLQGTTITSLGEQILAASSTSAMKSVIFTGSPSNVVLADGSDTALTTSIIPEGSNLYFTNSRALSATASTYVPQTTTVNGHALSGNVTVSKSDVGLANVDNTSDASKAFSTSQITSGTFANALVAQSNVTQYQSALSIGAGQVTGTKTSSFISDFATAARNLISVTGNGTYNSTTGVIQINAPTKSFAKTTPALNATGAQISTTQDAYVSCSVDMTVSSLLIGAASGTVSLKYADNAAMTTNPVTVMAGNSATSGVLSLINTNTATLTGFVPAGKFRQLTSVTNSGTVTYSTPSCQEVLF